MEPALADARPSCYPVAVAAVPVTPGFSSGQSCRNPSCSQDPLRSPLGWDSHADPLGSWVTLCPARPSPRCYGVVVQTPWRGGPGPGPRAGRPGSEICFRFATFYWGLLVTHPDLILVPVQCQEHRILLTTARPSALGPARALLLCRAVSTGPLSAGCHWLPHPSALRWPVPVSRAHRGLRRLSPGRWCLSQHRPKGSASWCVLRPPRLPDAAIFTASLLLAGPRTVTSATALLSTGSH